MSSAFEDLRGSLALPMIAAPMAMVSSKELVVACCQAGIVGAFPTFNSRKPGELEQWLEEIETELKSFAEANPGAAVPPYAVNVMVGSRTLADEMETIVRHKVPLVLPSGGNPKPIVEPVHGYGGLVFTDVSTVAQARKAVRTGVDGLILLCAGSGGNTGWINPFAFVPAVREFYDGPVAVAGAIGNGRTLRAIEVLGADLGYVGTPFIPTEESLVPPAYREMLVGSASDDVITTNTITGFPMTFLRPALEQGGFFAERTERRFPVYVEDDRRDEIPLHKAWSAGHGVGEVKAIAGAKTVVEAFKAEYAAAKNG